MTTRRTLVAGLSGIAVLFIALPLAALLAKAPWSDLGGHLGNAAVRQALLISLQTSFGALGICLVLGLPLAWVLARGRAPGALRALVLVPMVLPPVVGGAALLFAFGRNGLIPLGLSFTTLGATLAGAFVALPFLVLALEAGLRQLDPRYEDAAAVLGATPTRRFLHITLPQLAPAVAAGSVLAWARALGEFGATITFAGNLPGETQTLPLAVYVALQSDREAALALSLVLLGTAVAMIAALRGRWLTR